MARDSEFRAYAYIRETLKDLGWDTRNPRRGGAVYTQGEFRRHDPVLHDALGMSTPENIVLIPWRGGFVYWVVEAKAEMRSLPKAISEAKDYADAINAISDVKARFVSGTAGTPDQSIYIETHYWDGSQWSRVSINSYDATGLLSQEQCRRILDRNSADADFFDDDPDRFLRKSEAINRTLHSNEIPIGDRAKILAALLLALAYDSNLPVHGTTRRMVREVNGCIQEFLREHDKGHFAPAVELVEPIAESNHTKFRRAVVETLQHLREMNIRSAINSNDDALGKFYETFLKYANGAKEMGIVLTPRHVTRFAVDILGVGSDDRVFDPACGTGGFLVAAMDSMRESLDAPKYATFKTEGLFGIEQRDDVYGLALVNMIFRGDGKSNIENGNCFDFDFWIRDGTVFKVERGTPRLDGAQRPFAKVFMNPPFKLEETAETEFVDYALEQTMRGGMLFAVLPYVVIEGISYQRWREEFLKRHTLKAVIKLDKNEFYPVTESTYALVAQAHTPHQEDREVCMSRLFDDNHRPRRSKHLSNYDAADNLEVMTDALRRFLSGRPLGDTVTSMPKELIVARVLSSSFAPEAYLDGGAPVGRPNTSSRRSSLLAAQQEVLYRDQANDDAEVIAEGELGAFRLLDLVDEIITPPLSTLKDLKPGDTSIISATSKNNGIGGWRNVSEELRFQECITISRIHNTKPCEAFWHPYEFSALSGKVYVLKPKHEWVENESAVLYLCQAITDENSWRYDYARQVKLDEIEVHLPAKNGQIDFGAMVS